MKNAMGVAGGGFSCSVFAINGKVGRAAIASDVLLLSSNQNMTRK